MKIRAGIAIAAIIFSATASAQHSSQPVAFGLKGGLNVYNVNNEDGEKYDSKLGFHAGALAHIHLASQLALQPEVVYSSQGAKYNFGSTEAKLKLGYVNVPVMVQYMFDNGFRIQAGPQVGFLINAKTEVGNVETDVKDQLKTVDFGVGAGIAYVDPRSGFGVDARYNLGLSDINDDNSNSKSTNRGFQVGVFYLFHK